MWYNEKEWENIEGPKATSSIGTHDPRVNARRLVKRVRGGARQCRDGFPNVVFVVTANWPHLEVSLEKAWESLEHGVYLSPRKHAVRGQ